MDPLFVENCMSVNEDHLVFVGIDINSGKIRLIFVNFFILQQLYRDKESNRNRHGELMGEGWECLKFIGVCGWCMQSTCVCVHTSVWLR